MYVWCVLVFSFLLPPLRLSHWTSIMWWSHEVVVFFSFPAVFLHDSYHCCYWVCRVWAHVYVTFASTDWDKCCFNVTIDENLGIQEKKEKISHFTHPESKLHDIVTPVVAQRISPSGIHSEQIGLSSIQSQNWFYFLLLLSRENQTKDQERSVTVTW